MESERERRASFAVAGEEEEGAGPVLKFSGKEPKSRLNRVKDSPSRARSPSFDRGESSGAEDEGTRRHVRAEDSQERFKQTVSKASVQEAQKEREKKEKRRLRILEELLDTEKSYVESLQTLVLLVLNPLRKKLGNEKDQILSEKDIKLIFRNVEDVILLHKDFLGLFRQRLSAYDESTTIVSDLLRQLFCQDDFVPVYQRYINSFDDAVEHVTSVQEKSSFKRFMETQQQMEVALAQGLTQFLIMPVQRLPRYILLLKDLISKMDEDHVDYTNLNAVLSTISDLTNKTNQKKGQTSDLNKMGAVLQKFEMEDMIQLMRDRAEGNKEMIKDGDMVEYSVGGNQKPRFVILFYDMLVCASRKGEKLKLEWKAPLGNATHISFPENTSQISVRVARKAAQFPFFTHLKYTIEPTGGDGEVMSWRKAFQKRKHEAKVRRGLDFSAMDIYSHKLASLLPEREWTLLSLNATEVQVAGGEHLIKSGDEVKNFFLVKFGELRLVQTVDGKDYTINRIKNGECFGEDAILESVENEDNEGITSEYSVVADKPSIIVAISLTNLWKTLLSESKIAASFFELLCSSLMKRSVTRTFEEVVTHQDGDAENASRNNFSAEKKPNMMASLNRSVSPDAGADEMSPRSKKKFGTLRRRKSERSVISSALSPRNETEEKSKGDDDRKKKKIDGQPVLAEYDCKLLEKKKVKGTIFLTQSGIVFHAKGFGKKNNVTIAGNSIVNAVYGDECSLVIATVQLAAAKMYEFQFDTDEMRDQANRILGSLSYMGGRTKELPASSAVSSSSGRKSRRSYCLTPDLWTILRMKADDAHYKDGAVVLEAGEMTQHLHIVGEGALLEGKRKLSSGQCCGELGFLMGLTSRRSVIAEGDCRVAKISRAAIRECSTDEDVVTAGVMVWLGQQLILQIRKQDRAAIEKMKTEPVKSDSNDSITSPHSEISARQYKSVGADAEKDKQADGALIPSSSLSEGSSATPLRGSFSEDSASSWPSSALASASSSSATTERRSSRPTPPPTAPRPPSTYGRSEQLPASQGRPTTDIPRSTSAHSHLSSLAAPPRRSNSPSPSPASIRNAPLPRPISGTGKLPSLSSAEGPRSRRATVSCYGNVGAPPPPLPRDEDDGGSSSFSSVCNGRPKPPPVSTRPKSAYYNTSMPRSGSDPSVGRPGCSRSGRQLPTSLSTSGRARPLPAAPPPATASPLRTVGGGVDAPAPPVPSRKQRARTLSTPTVGTMGRRLPDPSP